MDLASHYVSSTQTPALLASKNLGFPLRTSRHSPLPSLSHLGKYLKKWRQGGRQVEASLLYTWVDELAQRVKMLDPNLTIHVQSLEPAR